MTITRYGAGETGAGGQALPFARAVQANGWLYVSGQVAMEEGRDRLRRHHPREPQDDREHDRHPQGGGLRIEDIVRIGVWLDDPRDFWSFNGVYAEYFAEPTRRHALASSPA